MSSARKISNLAVTTTLSANDRVVVLTNPSSSANTKTITLSNFANNLLLSNNVPAVYNSNGIAGQIAFDNNYIYICVSNNNWGRTSLELSW